MLFRAGVPRHSIIKKFAGEDISNLEDFISALSKLSRGARVPLEFISHTDRHRRKVLMVHQKYSVDLTCYVCVYSFDECIHNLILYFPHVNDLLVLVLHILPLFFWCLEL